MGDSYIDTHNDACTVENVLVSKMHQIYVVIFS